MTEQESPDWNLTTMVPADGVVAVGGTVSFTNQGDNDEFNVKVTLKIQLASGSGSPITLNKTVEQIAKGELAALPSFQKLGQVAVQAHPTYDHYLPLLYAAGAVDPARDAPKFFNADFQAASISMRSVIWS